jgi:hypothetical protein
MIVRIRQRMGLGTRLSVYREKGLEFDPAMLSIGAGTYLDGYWQCERYFKDLAERIREDFKILTAPNEANAMMLQQILETEAVSVHIRRGDYVSNPETNAVHGTCDLDYYVRAAELMKSRVGRPLRFFVFSDEPAWVRANLDLGAEMTFIEHNGPNADYEDMRLMSACKHHIIANSSFSWWGAWLNPSPNKLVVAPKRWFRTNNLSDRDLVPTDWIRV